ncbi:MAG: hypothetical protein HRT45_09575 [Bdellovibrionales bacterium]|nr:hypothetical protein [Bdellovibrionales bacterium]
MGARLLVLTFVALTAMAAEAEYEHDNATHAAIMYNEFQVPRLTQLEQQWQKRIWLTRVSRSLWKGYNLRDSRLLDRWLQMDEESVVLEMLADERFLKTAIDFGYFYLGRKSHDIPFSWENPDSLMLLNQYPNVAHLARQLESGEGDFFDFYSADAPVYLARLRNPPNFTTDPEKPADPNATPKEIRERLVDDWVLAYIKFKEYLNDTAKGYDKSFFCSEILDSAPLTRIASFYGYDTITFFNAEALRQPFFRLSAYCGAPNGPDYSREELLAMGTEIHSFVVYLHLLTQKNYELDVYAPRRFADLKLIPEMILPTQSAHPFEMSYANYISNNSTNFNRKRAAYILDRFFCDDLTPVAIEDSGDHTSDKHGTQATCMACHYRLDPMAGFFKSRGNFFRNYSGEQSIVFDDNAVLPLDEYVDAWRNPADHQREWDIGYVRSQKDEQLNSYGETLADLSEILKTAPEVRSCLVKRVFQYMTSSDQTFDGDYMDFVTATFNNQSKQNSVQAFKRVFGTAALSQTFAENDRLPNECYDFEPGADPANRPPCQVASILEKTCYKCHSSPDGRGNLNLDTWVKVAPGQFSFEHWDREFNRVPRSETMASIAERLSSPNPRLRMPKGGGHMNAVDRKDLYLWALEQAGIEEGEQP